MNNSKFISKDDFVSYDGALWLGDRMSFEEDEVEDTVELWNGILTGVCEIESLEESSAIRCFIGDHVVHFRSLLKVEDYSISWTAPEVLFLCQNEPYLRLKALQSFLYQWGACEHGFFSEPSPHNKGCASLVKLTGEDMELVLSHPMLNGALWEYNDFFRWEAGASLGGNAVI